MVATCSRKAVSLAISVALGLTATAASASADSIYLKNGNVIRTSSTAVDGERLLFSQFGKQMAIPLAIVDRVEEDDFQDPAPSPPRPAPDDSALAAGSAPNGQGDEVIAPEQTPEYWQDRVRAIHDEKAELELQLLDLRRTEKAKLFAHHSTEDIRVEIEGVLERLEANERALPELRREARRSGVPAGWLRI